MEHDSRTIWCGNLPEEATEELLYELFLQAGPLEVVKIARDKDGRKRNFGFITYRHEVSVPYALQLFKATTLFKRQLNLQARGGYRPPPPPPPVHRPQPVQSTYEIPQKLKDMRNEFKLMTQELVNKENNQQTELLLNISNEDDLTAASLQGNWSHRHHPYHKEYNKNRNHEPSRSHRAEQVKHYRNDNRQHRRDDREEEHYNQRSYNNTHLQRPRNNKSNSGYRRRR